MCVLGSPCVTNPVCVIEGLDWKDWKSDIERRKVRYRKRTKHVLCVYQNKRVSDYYLSKRKKCEGKKRDQNDDDGEKKREREEERKKEKQSDHDDDDGSNKKVDELRKKIIFPSFTLDWTHSFWRQHPLSFSLSLFVSLSLSLSEWIFLYMSVCRLLFPVKIWFYYFITWVNLVKKITDRERGKNRKKRIREWRVSERLWASERYITWPSHIIYMWFHFSFHSFFLFTFFLFSLFLSLRTSLFPFLLFQWICNSCKCLWLPFSLSLSLGI